MTALLDWIISSVHSVNWLTRDLVAAFAIMCETTIGLGVIVPGDTVVLIAGTGVKNIADFLGLYAFVLLGSLVGETLGFLIGRWFGPRLRASALGRRIGERNWQGADAFIAARGGLAVALSRFLPVLHSVVPVATGMSKMTYRTFIRWTVAACTVWAAIYLGIGWVLHRSYELWLGRLKFGGVIFVLLIVLVIVVITLVKKRLEVAADRIIVAEEALEGENQAIDLTETTEGLE
jgi:membrane-associated protein